MEKVHEFKYLGATVQGKRECGKEVRKRVQAERSGWSQVSGVFWNKRVAAKGKGNLYKRIVRLAVLFGLELLANDRRQRWRW